MDRVESGGHASDLEHRRPPYLYRAGDQMLAVDVTMTPEVRLGEPHVLFEKHFGFGQSITVANHSPATTAASS